MSPRTKKGQTTAVEWTCEYRECNNKFMRYQYQINSNTGKYCCQVCASYESALIRKARGEVLGNVPSMKECEHCGAVTSTWKTSCAVCRKIEQDIRRYGLTITQYYDMVKQQNGLCNICGVDRCNTGRRYAVDHDHATGRVRGLLCFDCNTRLGWYDRNKEAIDRHVKEV